jgi:dipeptidyl aminopeptidase/acylaminoacyl peptidase
LSVVRAACPPVRAALLSASRFPIRSAELHEHDRSIWVQQVFGGKSIRITHEPTDGFLPVFSPDGTMIAFRSQKDGGGIYEMPALGGEPRLIVSAPPSDPPGAPKYTPDGLRVLFKNEHNHLCMVPREGGKIVEIQPEFEMTNLHFFALSPDGKKVLTRGHRNGRAEQDRKRWWLISIPDGKLEDIDPPNQHSIPFFWVALGKDSHRQWVIFNGATENRNDLFRVAITSDGKLGRDAEQLTWTTGDAFSPTVSEGGKLMFSNVNDSESLWGIPIDTDRAKVTGERQQLTPLPGGLDPRPSLSRDGKKVTYMSGERVVVVDLATRQETQLATGEISSISSDGLFVVYFSQSPVDNIDPPRWTRG